MVPRLACCLFDCFYLVVLFMDLYSSVQGVGWWKYEFCYGKHVHQYHEVRGKIMFCILNKHTYWTTYSYLDLHFEVWI